MEKARVTRLAPPPSLEGSDRRAHSPRRRRPSRNLSRTLATGEVIGKHRIIKRLGRGSMGDVYLCEHIDLPDLRVALKVLAPAHGSTPELRTRFRNEIAASARVNHRNTIRPYEFIQNGDLLAYTMEYVDGGDLADWMRNHPSFSIREALDLLVQVCAGVKAIHAAGIVHRDLKPQNLLVTAQGEVRISDFAVSRTEDFERVTVHGKMVGTIDYISPQYLEHGLVTPGCDIYAIGAIAFEIFTRRPPFVADAIYETLSMKLRGEAPRADTINPSCPKIVADVIEKALKRDSSLRFKTAEEFADALIQLMNSPQADRVIHTLNDTPPAESELDRSTLSITKSEGEVGPATPVQQYLPLLIESNLHDSRPQPVRHSRSSFSEFVRMVQMVGVGIMLGAGLIVVITTYLAVQQHAFSSGREGIPSTSPRAITRIPVDAAPFPPSLIDTSYSSRQLPRVTRRISTYSKIRSTKNASAQSPRPRWAILPTVPKDKAPN